MTPTAASPALTEADQALRKILEGLDIRFTLEEHFVRLHAECVHQRRVVDACQQAAGKALGYPWFKDDQKNFPGATEETGVCIGEHVEDTIVEELAKGYATLRARATAAEDKLRDREAEIERLQKEKATLVSALEAVRDRIIEPIHGGIDDTFWMTPGETVVDFIDVALMSWLQLPLALASADHPASSEEATDER